MGGSCGPSCCCCCCLPCTPEESNECRGSAAELDGSTCWRGGELSGLVCSCAESEGCGCGRSVKQWLWRVSLRDLRSGGCSRCCRCCCFRCWAKCLSLGCCKPLNITGETCSSPSTTCIGA
eukprot:scaffold104370_cov22-Tisochrysis_lutea.AAC.2